MANTCGNDQHLNIDITVSSSVSWHMRFSGKGPVVPGTYVDNNTFPAELEFPDVDLSTGGRGCNSYGRFVVTEAVYGGNHVIRRFRATFENRCSSPSAPALAGEINLVDVPVGGGVIC